ncbi:hypothetical protein CcaverHIS002_0510640 [Cutaneotrichosporon cavernicola]|nr:hypothetical protein CcaverHIS002_0510640 [Cutaneotrichosporon cavernicola]
MPSVRSQKSFCNESLRLRLVVEVNVDIQPALEAFKRKLEAVKGASPKDETRLESFLKAYNNSEDDNVCYAIVKSQTDSCRNCCNAREQQACLFIVRGTTEEARHKVLAARLGIYESDIGANLVVAIDG